MADVLAEVDSPEYQARFADVEEAEDAILFVPSRTSTSASAAVAVAESKAETKSEGKSAARAWSLDLSGVGFDSKGKIRGSKNDRRDAFIGLLKFAQHLLRGHFLNDGAMRTAYSQGKPNFSWSSDRAALAAIAASGGVTKEVDIPAGAGYGYVRGSDGNRYRVEPKKARIVFKSGGDFKTAYGVTEETTVASFAAAYHSATRA